MDKLKPCPFCGREVGFFKWGNGWSVECRNIICCSVLPETEICETKEVAAEIWNRRGGDTDGKERTE